MYDIYDVPTVTTIFTIKNNHSCRYIYFSSHGFLCFVLTILSFKKRLVFFWPMAAGWGKFSSRGCHVVQWWFFRPYMPLVKFQWVSNVEQFFVARKVLGKTTFPVLFFLDIPRLMPRGSLI